MTDAEFYIWLYNHSYQGQVRDELLARVKAGTMTPGMTAMVQALIAHNEGTTFDTWKRKMNKAMEGQP